MKVSIASSAQAADYATRAYLQRMWSPLCGLDQRITFVLRNRREPRFLTAAAELAGVHLLQNRPKPKTGSYHIGGSGVVLDEALIRALGETVERYSQLVSEIHNRRHIVLASYDEMAKRREAMIPLEKLQFFSEEQYARPGFPFRRFSRDLPFGWIRVPQLAEDGEIWVPAQLILVGYAPKDAQGEKWLFPAFTTGSAAHTKREHALRNALLELIQIDAVMGHWYSSATAARIMPDKRTQALDRLIAQHFSSGRPQPKFYWIPDADLHGMTIACVVNDRPGIVPAAVVGLGSDLKLVDAMYKALLEAVAVAQLAKVTLLDRSIGERSGGSEIDPAHIFNLDENVAYYSLPANSQHIGSKFVDRDAVCASDLPPDSALDTHEQIRLLVDGFAKTGKQLIYLDLTTEDIRQLGFVAVRVWSPDTLSLSLPSAPPARHPRFTAYGGFCCDHPHPYP